MMKRILFLALIFTGLFSLPAAACEQGNPGSNDYILRDNNRCEGIRPRSVVGGSVELISLTTSQGTRGSTILIRVPRVANTPPSVLVREIENRYQLDQLQLRTNGDYYEFRLPADLLSRVNIALADLRATASSSGQVVYSPVIFQRPSDSYRFVFYSINSVRFVDARIRSLSNRTEVAAWGPQNAKRGEKAFAWENARNSPEGRYEFYYVAEVQQRSGPPERISRSVVFEHDPDWLR